MLFQVSGIFHQSEIPLLHFSSMNCCLPHNKPSFGSLFIILIQILNLSSYYNEINNNIK